MKLILIFLVFALCSFNSNGQFGCGVFSTRINLDEGHILFLHVTKHKFSISTESRIISLDENVKHLAVYIVQITDSTQWITPCTDVFDGRPYAKQYYPVEGTLEIRLIPYQFFRIHPKTGIMDTIYHYKLEGKIRNATFQNRKTLERIKVPDTLIFRDPKSLYGSKFHRIHEGHQISFQAINPLNYDEVSVLIKNRFVDADSIYDNTKAYFSVLIDKEGRCTSSFLHPPALETIYIEFEEIIKEHLRYPKRGKHEMPEKYRETLLFFLQADN